MDGLGGWLVVVRVGVVVYDKYEYERGRERAYEYKDACKVWVCCVRECGCGGSGCDNHLDRRERVGVRGHRTRSSRYDGHCIGQSLDIKR